MVWLYCGAIVDRGNRLDQPLNIAGLEVLVTRKRIKTLRLRVCPPDGQVRISAPLRASENHIRALVEEKLSWIKKHRDDFLSRPRNEPFRFVSGETHYVFGELLPLRVSEVTGRARVELGDDELLLSIKPGTPCQQRERLLDEWYRRALKSRLPSLITTWQPVIGREVAAWGVKKMKTRWGTCNISERRIWINLELAKRPPQCLEYILVHEMVHLLERHHNRRFYNYMDKFMPHWRDIDKLLK